MEATQLQREIETVQQALQSGVERSQGFQHALDRIASRFGAVTATLHRAQDGWLHMVASQGIPDQLREATARIPFGKGMAGLCAQRREPITVCNLQTDESGQARPGAKQTGVAGAITVPIFDDGGHLIGTLGIGKAGEHEYTAEEHALLEAYAHALASALQHETPAELRVDSAEAGPT